MEIEEQRKATRHYDKKSFFQQPILSKVTRLALVLKTIFNQCVISYTYSQSSSDDSVLIISYTYSQSNSMALF